MLDTIGWNIVKALQENARLSYAELGRQVGLTAPAVAERVRKLRGAPTNRGSNRMSSLPTRRADCAGP